MGKAKSKNVREAERNDMKKHIGTGKVVKKSEWLGANKVKVTYSDLSSEELTRQAYDQVIREVKDA